MKWNILYTGAACAALAASHLLPSRLEIYMNNPLDLIPKVTRYGLAGGILRRYREHSWFATELP
jgi:hypothetical protein